MSYATPSDVLTRYDARTIGQLVSDTGVPVNNPNLMTNTNLLAALSDASGIINSACLTAGRYQVSDLQSLTGDDKAYLTRLTVEQAFIFCVMRRGMEIDKLPQRAWVEQTLQQLREGVRIFNVQASVEAGNPTVSFPSQAVIHQRNFAVDYASRAFPVPRWQQVT